MVMDKLSRFITEAHLAALAGELSGQMPVLVPVRSGQSIVFKRFQAGMELDFSRLPAVSPKAAVFPQNETLLLVRHFEAVSGKKPQLLETLPKGKSLVLGCRPCGARGKLIFDPVYNTEQIRDPYYAERRENTLFVTLSCERPESTCFCESVGGGPADTSGSDVLLTKVADGFVALAVTEAGQKLLENPLFDEAGERVGEADAVNARASELMGAAHDFSDAPEKLLARFDDMEFWDEQAAKCLSCGACTYICPTCYCFNITDNEAGLLTRRLRSWDNCMSHTFTLEGSGHNPRTSKAHRLKNRIGHKFSYYPSLHKQTIACCGCGRCIKQCPAGVDIRRIVTAAQEYVEGQ